MGGVAHVKPGERARGSQPPGVWVMGVTLEGATNMFGGGGVMHVKRGDVTLIGPGAENWWQVPATASEGKGGWTIVYVVFTPRPHWLAWMQYPQPIPFHSCLKIADPAHWRRIVRAMKQAQLMASTSLPERAELALNAVEAALLWCRADQAHQSLALDPRVSAAVTHLSTRLRDPITLASLAAVCHSSRARIAALFRQQVGVPPMEFLESRRMRLAAEMLRMTGEPVRQVALAVGFEDPNYFTKRFRRYTGMSPRRFRQKPGEAPK